MSKRASPPILGAFIVGGLLLIAFGLIVVGARGLFAPKSRLVLYFPGSVNGLQIGSAVKFKGVLIGQVRRIRISLATSGSGLTIPVIIEVDDRLVADATGEPLDLANPPLVRAMVAKGLRGSLELESFLTGMLYVGLNMYSNAPPPTYRARSAEFPEIPTIETGLQKLANSLPKVDRIFDLVEGIASELETMLRQIKVGQINDALLTTLTDAQQLLRSPSITNTFVSIEKMADEFRLTAVDLRGEIKPLVTRLNATADAATKAAGELDQVLLAAGRLVGDHSPVMNQLVATLADFQRTAVALRQLSDYLARNPQTILTGRDANDTKP